MSCPENRPEMGYERAMKLSTISCCSSHGKDAMNNTGDTSLKG